MLAISDFKGSPNSRRYPQEAEHSYDKVSHTSTVALEFSEPVQAGLGEFVLAAQDPLHTRVVSADDVILVGRWAILQPELMPGEVYHVHKRKGPMQADLEGARSKRGEATRGLTLGRLIRAFDLNSICPLL